MTASQAEPCYWPQVAKAFLKLGLVAFGGPAAHLALLEDEFVTRRGWLSRQRFLDLMGATNLIPGPNSTEMTMHIGYERARMAGLVAAGVGFVLPAAAITGVLAWLYVAFGTLPASEQVLAGVRPTVLVVILGALWKLGRKAVKSWLHGVIAVGALAAIPFGVTELAALLFASVLGAILLRVIRLGPTVGAVAVLVLAPLEVLASSRSGELLKLGLFFLKVGSVLYGSGYVLVAFLEGGLVEGYGWISRQQLLDAIAVGQFTPGPVLTAATFVGFLVAGPVGAAVATAGIFLPAFAFTRILHPLVGKLRKSATSAAFLEAVTAAAVGLMGAVVLDLGRATLGSPVSWIVFVAATAAVFVLRWPAMWVVAGGALVGMGAAVAEFL